MTQSFEQLERQLKEFTAAYKESIQSHYMDTEELASHTEVYESCVIKMFRKMDYETQLKFYLKTDVQHILHPYLTSCQRTAVIIIQGCLELDKEYYD